MAKSDDLLNFFDELDAFVSKKTPGEPKERVGIPQLVTFVRGDDFMATEFAEQEWLVEQILPAKGMVCLSGMPSSYKSWFGFYLALCVMKGSPVLEEPLKGRAGWKTDKGAVLFIDKENVEKQVQERMRMLGAGEEMKNCYFLQGNFTTENLHSIANVKAFVQEHNIKMVIIDSLVRIHSRNENEAVEMNKVFERLAELQDAGATVLYLHHLRKATTFSHDPMERLRGSIDIAARLDSLIAFDNDEKNVIKVSHGKSRYTKAFAPFFMRFEVDQNNKAYFNFDKDVDPSEVEVMVCIDAVYSLLKDNAYTRKHLLEQLSGQYAVRSIAEAINTLAEENKIEKHRQGKEVIYRRNPLYELSQRKLTEEEKKDLD